ncbi:MAG: type II toxin-antitoxin system YhaV family toxin [Hormoscilla sp.]
MSNLICNGWNVQFHPIFQEQRQDLMSNANRLRGRLTETEYLSHPQVKLFLAVRQAYLENILSDPFAPRFALRGDLRDYKRLKGMGLSSRYRLFFRVFQEGERKEIVILWLGYPRKEGDKKDCYAVFHKMVVNEVFPESVEALIAECEI